MERPPSKIMLVFFGFLFIYLVFYTTVDNGFSWKNLKFSIESFEETPQNISWDSNIKKVKIETSFVFVDSTRDVQNVCALPVYDFWYDAVKNVMTGADPTKNCDRNFKPWTELSNSSWRIVRDGANCSARCMEGNGAKQQIAIGKWMKPGKVSCEFLEVVCWENGTEVYGWIHTQLVPKPRPTITPSVSSEKKPNVYVFSIDSMGTGMAKRSLPKFLEYFRKEYNGVEFPFVNKVGENTKPNAIPLYFGKSIENARKVTWKELKADWNFTEYCETFLDNYTSIFNDFERDGFMTMSLEDWMPTMVDAWPTCKGFQFAPSHHTFRPFASTMEAYGTHITKQHLKGKFCREKHHAVLEYLEQSFEPYKDRPVFAWTWLINIAHNHVDGVARIDQLLVDYFQRNKEKFENSFVLFVSDHGFRFGGHLGSELGRFERDNPYLNIAIPKYYRHKKFGILDTLKTNSLKLQTHFDTRATLLDILKYQPGAKFMDRDPISIPNEKGNSLIRRQPGFPRTCATLPIPRQYCICQVEKFQILNDTLKFHLGQKLLDHVHDLLDKSNYTSICREYKLQEVILLEFGYTKAWNTYNIEVKTASSSPAHFQTMMTYDGNNDSANFEKVVRLDSYGKTPDCTAPIRHDPLCYCKVQPKTE
ncbi:hypothetical protein CAEBREN_20635 [Caenorhabditis brenneri]|uniref:Uncharacterized protein n=1 Tax=Caenorhabditis brenneri TaxID=135651 RepID=G0PG86_CAEBE|nr:hypothetical protein CAEBREN_20635 [Caenorhabditis brenneri]